MSYARPIPDKTLLKSVLQKMTQKGTASNRITATVRSGDATLSGTIAHEYERRAIVRSVSAVQGIRRVIDQLRVVEKKKHSC